MEDQDLKGLHPQVLKACADVIFVPEAAIQQVKYLTRTSAIHSISIGVPQGSILGPLLFIIYVNDLVNTLHNVHPVIFADDKNLVDDNLDHAITNFNKIPSLSSGLEISSLSSGLESIDFPVIFPRPIRFYSP